MSLLPARERILLGPGPSMTSPRVMRALGAPTLSHLDPQMLTLLDDIRARLLRTFGGEEGSFAFAVSGTGTAGMETTIANLVQPGMKVLVVVSGYFGDRLAQMCERYGATVQRLPVEWGRACDPRDLEKALDQAPADLVAMVHAETSTGVLNPVEKLAAIARARKALVLVDTVTSFGGHPLKVGEWGIDAAYSCTQKCLGGPSGMSPVIFGPRALERRVACRSFYLDLTLLEDYWLRRKYHHTMSSAMIYALYEALSVVEDEGLEARWARHEANHRAFIDRLAARGLSVLPPVGERLWTLNAVRVPEGIDEAAVRKHLLDRNNIEIGAGLGPLAGKIWRIGLMGESSDPRLMTMLDQGLEQAFAAQGRSVSA